MAQTIGVTASVIGMTLGLPIGLIAEFFEGVVADRLMEANLWQG